MKRHDLTVEIIRRQIESLLAAYPEMADDADLLADMIEGETDAFEVMRELVREYLVARSFRDCLQETIADFKKRQDRADARVDRIRELMGKILVSADMAKFELPEATLSMRAGKQSVVITDEAALPESMIKISRSPDKMAIGQCLSAGNDVPGASLSNGSPTLMIRAV